MSSSAHGSSVLRPFSFQLLRYSPTALSQEFFNIAVLLYDDQGRVLDARFAPDLRRMQCNPAVEMELLSRFKSEFEERLLLGEGFSEYVVELSRNLSNSLELSEPRAFYGSDPAVEMERLTRQYVATPKPLSEDRASGGDPTGRAALRRRIDDAFESRRLFADGRGVQRSRRVAYGDSGLEFTFDYGYERPSGAEQFIQTLSRRGEMNDVSRLCLVLDRLRGFREQQVGLAAVYAEHLSGESRALFAGSGIEPWDIAEVDALAERVHADLGR